MTNVNLFGVIVKKDDDVFIKVERSYKDQSGNYIDDLLPVIFWTKNKSNNFSNLKESSRVLIKGRLECIGDKMYIVVEEFKVV